MEKFIVTTGKTIDLAIEAALAQLKLDRDSVSVEVLRNARAGFLGIGASPAEVKVTYEAPDEKTGAPKSALSAASRSKPKERQEPASSIISRPGKKPAETNAHPQKPTNAPRQPKNTNAPRAPKSEGNAPRAPKAEAPRAPKAEAPRAPKTEAASPRPAAQKKAETYRAPKPEVSVASRTYAPAQPGSIEESIELFLKGLLAHMGSEAVPHAYLLDEGSYRADMVGGDTGMLIGRRGETLDAIQYLTGYAINRDRETRLRISVDAGDYRYKREEALRQLAGKMAAKAVKYRRNFTLEPMNAYERHVIHAALQEYPEVTTFSTGAEPHRRIVVSFAKEK